MRIGDLGSRIAKEIQVRTPLRRYFLHRYSYMFSPAQLAFLCSCVEQAVSAPGGICEIGCAQGASTVFLNRHLDWLGIARPYTAIDTFSGFTKEDVTIETERGKPSSLFSGMFTVNSKTWFDRTMALNGLGDRVRSIQADANEFDFRPLAPLAFCLIDVDLYRPVAASLQKVYPLMSPHGIIVVDDCTPNTGFDGALQAYEEFASSRGLPSELTLRKLGVIRVPGPHPQPGGSQV